MLHFRLMGRSFKTCRHCGALCVLIASLTTIVLFLQQQGFSLRYEPSAPLDASLRKAPAKDMLEIPNDGFISKDDRQEIKQAIEHFEREKLAPPPNAAQAEFIPMDIAKEWSLSEEQQKQKQQHDQHQDKKPQDNLYQQQYQLEEDRQPKEHRKHPQLITAPNQHDNDNNNHHQHHHRHLQQEATIPVAAQTEASVATKTQRVEKESSVQAVKGSKPEVQGPKQDARTEKRIPERVVLEAMTDEGIVNLYHSYVMSPQSTCHDVRRMGRVKDGGWEMCDDIRFKPDPNNCLVYSFGINFDFSFDDDMAEYGCEVHSFDPSMPNTNDHLRGTRVHFHVSGIGAKNEIVNKNVPPLIWRLYTLAFHRQQLGHAVNQRRVDIVKMDVEGAELEAVTSAIQDGSLADVKQLSIETHLSFVGTPKRDRYLAYLDLLRNLYDAGFRIYLTARNHIWSSFLSPVIHKQRVTCHEINMVNIRNSNTPPS